MRDWLLLAYAYTQIDSVFRHEPSKSKQGVYSHNENSKTVKFWKDRRKPKNNKSPNRRLMKRICDKSISLESSVRAFRHLREIFS